MLIRLLSFGVLLLCVFSSEAFSQTKFRHHVKIKVTEEIKEQETESALTENRQYEDYNYKYVILKKASEKVTDTLLVPGNSILTSEQEKTIGGVLFKFKKDSTIIDSYIKEFEVNKSKSDTLNLPRIRPGFFPRILPKLRSGSYNANIKATNDTLYVNFWLQSRDTTKGKSLIKNLFRKCQFSRKNNCDVPYYSLNERWKKDVPISPEETYYITLKNRQSVKFPYRNFDLAAFTVPFKYHFGYTSSNDLEIDPNFNSDVNLSLFLGRRIGSIRYTYDEYNGMIERDKSVSIGLVAGLSSQKIDSASTSASENPISSEINVPSLSLGIGLVFHINDFNLGAFYGYDFGLGQTARKWNFNERPWLGFGFGYKLAFLKKPE